MRKFCAPGPWKSIVVFKSIDTRLVTVRCLWSRIGQHPCHKFLICSMAIFFIKLYYVMLCISVQSVISVECALFNFASSICHHACSFMWFSRTPQSVWQLSICYCVVIAGYQTPAVVWHPQRPLRREKPLMILHLFTSLARRGWQKILSFVNEINN